MAADLTYAYVGDITKVERDENGNLLVYGKATGPDLDLDEQRCDPAWLKKAMPAWAEWSNIREMHQPICAGVGMETEEVGDDWWVKSKVVDSNTATKIENKALRGYSIGIKNPTVVKDATAPGGRIVGGDIVEISYVDRPCNPDAMMAICKMVGAGNMLGPVEADTEEITIKVAGSVFSPGDLAKLLAVKKAAEADHVKSDKDEDDDEDATDESEQAADGGDDGDDDDDRGKSKTKSKAKTKKKTKGAMAPLKPGGPPRYPIESVQDLKDAIRAIGRVKEGDRQEVIAHIKSEAKRLGRSDLIPTKWKALEADLSKADRDGGEQKHDPAELRDILTGLVGCMKAELDELLGGENELCDLYDLLSTISMFCRWWSSEAAGGETDSPYGGTAMSTVTLAADTDTTKTVSTTDTSTSSDTDTETTQVEPDDTKTTEPDTTTAEGSVDENRLAELVKSAIAKETKALTEAAEERNKALTAELEAVKAELAKVAALPEPGGPVITRTAGQAAAAKAADAESLKREAEGLLAKATDVEPYDARLANGYRVRARDLLKTAGA